MNDKLLDTLKTFLAEALLHKKLILLACTLISLIIAFIGSRWPQQYVSYATIMVDNNSVIQPLMQGTAVPTDINEHARIARDLIFSRKLLGEVAQKYMDTLNQMDEQAKQLDKNAIIQHIQNNAQVTSSKDNLIMVQYRSDMAEDAMRVAQLLTNTYIAESISLKLQEGQSVYDFIDNQVRQYDQRLTQLDKEIKKLRVENIDIVSRRAATERLDKLDDEIEKTRKDLVEKKLAKQSLERQLTGESNLVANMTREDMYAKRLADLQTQLDTLRLSYHETYPDIIQIRHQIDDIRALLERERQISNSGNSEEKKEDNRKSVINPIASDLRLGLYKAESEIAILNNRVDELQRKRREQIAQMPQIGDTEVREAELTRDFEVTHAVYQDLLKKREQARVSMNLDREGQGKALRLYAPAFVPTKPQGIRFSYFLVASQILGLGLPLGILFLYLNFDKKIRSETIIAENLHLPLLGVIPHIHTRRESLTKKAGSAFAAILFMVNIGVVLSFAILYRDIL